MWVEKRPVDLLGFVFLCFDGIQPVFDSMKLNVEFFHVSLYSSASVGYWIVDTIEEKIFSK